MVKRHGNLWEKFISMENLREAFNNAKRGRSRNKHVQKILDMQKWDILGTKRVGETREEYLIRREKRITKYLKHLQYILETGKYKTSAYTLREIKDPKPRTLYILPLYPDRIVQHALVKVLKPIWEKLFVYESFACRKGKGQHRCSNYFKKCVKHHKYCGLTDIRKFYPNIPHADLYRVVQRKIKDKKILAVLKDVIYSVDGERNVPIGNLTSQWLGNLYLNELDQYTAHVLKMKKCPRYMDDKAYFSNDKKDLGKKLNLIEKFITEKLKLTLSKKIILRCDHGVPFIGYRHFPDYILLKKRTVRRMRKNIKMADKLYSEKKITLVQYTSKLGANYGWAKHANSYNLRKKLGLDVKFDNARKKIKEVKMRGFPQYANIATKFDVNNLIGIFPKETKKFLTGLLGDRFIWVDTGKLEDTDKGLTDDTHRVDKVQVISDDEETNNTYENHQMELVEDSNARIFRMGYTVNEVKTLIESLA